MSHLIATNYCATGDDITTIESLQLDYRIIQAATNNYSENNKIGEGGFGEVYKVLFSLILHDVLYFFLKNYVNTFG